MTAGGPLDELRGAVEEGEVHTVRVCFPDHYGVLRGRRIAADVFVADPDARQGFCDGALVWDIRCDIFEGADFSNYRTGYPDLYVRPERGTLKRCPWVEGEWSAFGDCLDANDRGIDVDPRGVLRAIAARAGSPLVAASLTLHLSDADRDAAERFLGAWQKAGSSLGAGDFTIERDVARATASFDLPAMAAIEAADALVTLRTASREIGQATSVDVTAMSQLEPGGPATLLMAAVVGDDGSTRPVPAVEDLALLLRPLPAGAEGVVPAGHEVAHGASDANPYLVVAAAIAAAAHGPESSPATPAGAVPYRESIRRLRSCTWAPDWFPGRFLHDTIALAEREAGICDAGDGPWDQDRYRECG